METQTQQATDAVPTETSLRARIETYLKMACNAEDKGMPTKADMALKVALRAEEQLHELLRGPKAS